MKRPWFPHLPHFHRDGLFQSVTFRLGDAVPASVVEAWKAELAGRFREGAESRRSVELHALIERYADAGAGACWLSEPRIGLAVAEALHESEGVTHELYAWCVMPNHVHALVHPASGVSLAEIVRTWKSKSSRAANFLLGREGPFWMRGYFDRYIRGPRHLERTCRYIEANPVIAGLASRPDEWFLSSAGAFRPAARMGHAGRSKA